MAKQIYEVPDTIRNLFEEKGGSFKIVDYNKEMDNIQAQEAFCEAVGIKEENIIEDMGTSAVLSHPDYEFKLYLETDGIGDFFHHSFEVSTYEE